MTGNMRRRLAAEGLGALLLTVTVIGSGIMAAQLTDDTALALLGNTLPTGMMLIVLIALLAPISGAHLNPAVTLCFLLHGDIEKRAAAGYAVAQIAGAILGAWLAHAMFDLSIVQTSSTERYGPGLWLSEVVATFGLVFTIFAALRAAPDGIPVFVGLYIMGAYWFTASTAFANPAVTIARALSESFSGIRPMDAPWFIASQLAGAILALVAVRWLYADVKD